MKVNVLFFSVLRDLAGRESMELELGAAEAGVGDVLARVYELHPRLRDWDERLLIAVNCAYADRSSPVAPGDEIALMPPVQGG